MTLTNLIKEAIDSKLKEIQEISKSDSSVDVVSAFEFLQYHLLKKINNPENKTDPKYIERVATIMHLEDVNKDLCSTISEIFALCVDDTARLEYFLDKDRDFEYYKLGTENEKELSTDTLNKTDEEIKNIVNRGKEDVFKNYYDAEELAELKKDFKQKSPSSSPEKPEAQSQLNSPDVERNLGN